MISDSEVEVIYGLYIKKMCKFQSEVDFFIFLFSCNNFTELISRNKVFTTNYALSVNECCKIKSKLVDE